MRKPSPANVSMPVFATLLGKPTGATMCRSGVVERDMNHGKQSLGRATNALRESNRENTQILYQQAGINGWLNAPYVLNIGLVALLSAVATALVYLIR